MAVPIPTDALVRTYTKRMAQTLPIDDTFKIRWRCGTMDMGDGKLLTATFVDPVDNKITDVLFSLKSLVKAEGFQEITFHDDEEEDIREIDDYKLKYTGPNVKVMLVQGNHTFLFVVYSNQAEEIHPPTTLN